MQDLAPSLSQELLASLQQSAALSPAQAQRAIDALLRFLAPRLPSPLFGQVRAAVAAPPAAAARPTGPDRPGDAA